MSKRRRELNSSSEDESKIFGKSKVVVRSPQKPILVESQTIGEESRLEMEEMKAMMHQMMEMLKNNTDEIKALREDVKRKEEQWNKEKQQLEEKIGKLEERLEEHDKRARKLNVLIKGAGKESLEGCNEVEEWFKKKLGIEVKTRTVADISKEKNRETLLVEIANWEMKMSIMKNKSKIKGTKIFIDNDLTKEERIMAACIRKMAKEERSQGKEVKVEYKKLQVDGQLFVWESKLQKLVEKAEPKN